MNNILNLFLSGAVVSLLSIIAAVGIVVNNSRASARQKADRKIKMKVDLLEKIYSNYNELTDKYILIMSSLDNKFFEIQREILGKGTDYTLQSFVVELQEFAQEALSLAVHKSKILDAYGIKVDVDELARYIVDLSKRIISFADIIAFVTKLYVVKYVETGNTHEANKVVVDELNNILDLSKSNSRDGDVYDVYLQDIDNQHIELIEGYKSAIHRLDDIEKSNINSRVSAVTRAYIVDLKKYKTEPLDLFEEQLVKAIKKLIK